MRRSGCCVVPAGAKDEEDLHMRSFLVEDGGVLVRTEYKKLLAEQVIILVL